MSELVGNDALIIRLLGECQAGFPLCTAPYGALASRLGVAENVLLRTLDQLKKSKRIARVGAVFAPKRIGASTLVAMSVPEHLLDTTVETIGRFPEVVQSYERQHELNLWFVATAGSEGRLQAALGAIEQTTGLKLLILKMAREFAPPSAMVPVAVSAQGAQIRPFEPDETGRRLVMALQEGLPLIMRPFLILASRVGCDEEEVLERINRWTADGVIKRFGVVVRRAPETVVGESGALWVLDVPDEQVSAVGSSLIGESGVSACAERARALPTWPYNLFCKITATTREEIGAAVLRICEKLGLSGYRHELIFPKST